MEFVHNYTANKWQNQDLNLRHLRSKTHILSLASQIIACYAVDIHGPGCSPFRAFIFPSPYFKLVPFPDSYLELLGLSYSRSDLTI